MNEAISKLRKTAAAATPGPWGADSIGYAEDDVRVQVTCGAWDLAMIDASAPPELRDTSVEQRIADAAHIATFDPPTVLAMLDVIEAAEGWLGDDDQTPGHAVGEKKNVRTALARFHDLFGSAE